MHLHVQTTISHNQDRSGGSATRRVEFQGGKCNPEGRIPRGQVQPRGWSLPLPSCNLHHPGSTMSFPSCHLHHVNSTMSLPSCPLHVHVHHVAPIMSMSTICFHHVYPSCLSIMSFPACLSTMYIYTCKYIMSHHLVG